MNKFLGFLASAFSFAVLFGIPAQGNTLENWFLMSRHGECAKIESLKRKIPNIGGVNSPEEFLKLMRKQRQKVEVRKMKELEGKAVEISVPDKGLHLMFVKEELCKEMSKK